MRLSKSMFMDFCYVNRQKAEKLFPGMSRAMKIRWAVRKAMLELRGVPFKQRIGDGPAPATKRVSWIPYGDIK